ncbi:MAG TPA: S46 family peptidase, partial [Thermoanaerobaculia bacterium]|nr:S46 family peptidase [Thermoanaerobaculia bacterium]
MKSANALCALLFVAVSAFADDGLWMPQQIPALAPELKKLGLQIDPNQFADLTGFPMGAIVALGGCSASFVSPEGLVVTNHHCVAGALQFNSTPENDLLRNGFLAKQRSQEITATPDARVYVTTAIEDVTKTILAPFPKDTTDRDRARLIRRRRREMINQCEAAGGVSCQVPSFFEGAQYLKITRMEIRDVRLVYAPPLGVGNFGDEIDNWMWPRHTGDFAYYRAYVGRDGRPADFSPENVPYRPKHWLKISTRDLDEGDLIMIAGFPGTTHRHETAAEIENAAEFELPTSVRYRTMLADVLRERGRNDRAIALKNASRISSLENYLKKHTGTLEAYRRAGIVAAKKKDESAIRAALDPKLGAAYDLAAAELQKILAEKHRTRERDTILAWLYTSSPMLTQANRLYRLSVERTKPDLDRDDLFTDSSRTRLKQTVTRARRSMDPGSDRAGLRLFLLEAARLPRDQRITPIDAALAATGKPTPEEQVDALLDRIYASTQIGNADAETKMFEETTAQLMARDDSMIAFAASLRPFVDAVESAETARAGAMSRLRPVMLDALRVARGGRLYPDANSTLRVNYGQVKGYAPRNAVRYAAQTDIRGIVEKETGEEPFASPKALLERAARQEFGPYVDPDLGTLPVAFISTNVVTNGNSGSATLNAWGELCGLSFDSNWEGVGSDYLVEQEITRSISVDSRYMLWVMDAVDGADNVLLELG